CWPPDFSAGEGKVVLFQPWEFGAIPSHWVEGIAQRIDEVWVPSSFVRDGFVQSGVSADKVKVIPLGADPDLFSPEAERYPLPTAKTFKARSADSRVPKESVIPCSVPKHTHFPRSSCATCSRIRISGFETRLAARPRLLPWVVRPRRLSRGERPQARVAVAQPLAR